jgi:hypothetical protein
MTGLGMKPPVAETHHHFIRFDEIMSAMGLTWGGNPASAIDASHAFTEGEWALVRTIADGLEWSGWSSGWAAPAAHRLRFLLDFGYATGLRALAEKLRRASPHWMRHTHATHALNRGAELTTVHDNLRHTSVSTTWIYLHSDEVKRARQIGDAFGRRK